MSISDTDRASDFFDSAYRERAPWDVGKPQPDLIALLDEYPPTGPVLEVGCGTGDLALAMAGRGLKVVGIDLAEAAIAQARSKAAAAGPDIGRLVEFRVADAFHPAQIPGPFGAIVDAGFFHLFGPLERDCFVDELRAALATGGRYYLLGFDFDSPYQNAPRRVSEHELRERFAADQGWRILALRPAQFLTRSGRGDVPAVAACLERVDQG
jgi:SAM-dependent methyltransferase